MNICTDIAQTRRQRVAASVFDDYDFGPFDVEAAQTWGDVGGNADAISRRLTMGEVSHVQGDEAPSFDALLLITFRAGSDEIESVACAQVEGGAQIGSFPMKVDGYTRMLFKEWSDTANELRLRAQELLDQAASLDGLKPFVVTHSHQYGASSYLVWKDSKPDEQDVVGILDGEFEPEKEEYLTIEDNIKTEELTGSSAVTRLSASSVRKLNP